MKNKLTYLFGMVIIGLLLWKICLQNRQLAAAQQELADFKNTAPHAIEGLADHHQNLLLTIEQNANAYRSAGGETCKSEAFAVQKLVEAACRNVTVGANPLKSRLLNELSASIDQDSATVQHIKEVLQMASSSTDSNLLRLNIMLAGSIALENLASRGCMGSEDITFGSVVPVMLPQTACLKVGLPFEGEVFLAPRLTNFINTSMTLNGEDYPFKNGSGKFSMTFDKAGQRKVEVMVRATNPATGEHRAYFGNYTVEVSE